MDLVKSQSKTAPLPKTPMDGDHGRGLPGSPEDRRARIKAAAKTNKETLRRLAE